MSANALPVAFIHESLDRIYRDQGPAGILEWLYGQMLREAIKTQYCDRRQAILTIAANLQHCAEACMRADLQ